MNEEQLAALTESERGDPDNCECGHSRLRHGNSGKRQCYEWVSEERRCPCRSLTLESAASRRELQAALADARLTIHEMEAYWIPPDKADSVAYELGGKIAILEAEVARLMGEHEATMVGYRNDIENVRGILDQQREDIRRLLEIIGYKILSSLLSESSPLDWNVGESWLTDTFVASVKRWTCPPR